MFLTGLACATCAVWVLALVLPFAYGVNGCGLYQYHLRRERRANPLPPPRPEDLHPRAHPNPECPRLPTGLHPWHLLWILPVRGVHSAGRWLSPSGAIFLSSRNYTQNPSALALGIRLLAFLPLHARLALQAARSRHLAGVPGTPAVAERSR